MFDLFSTSVGYPGISHSPFFAAALHLGHFAISFCWLGLRQNLGYPSERSEEGVCGKEDRERILADFHESGMSPRRFGVRPGCPFVQTIRCWLCQEEGLLDVPDVR